MSGTDPFRLLNRLSVAPALLTALLVVEAVGMAWGFGRAMPGFDYYQYWVAGQAIVERPDLDPYDEVDRGELARIYAARAARPGASSRLRAAAAGRTERLALSSSPFLYSLFAPLQPGRRDYDADLTRFRVLSLLCAGAALLWLARISRMSSVTALLILASYFLWYEPLYSELRVGNVNQIQLGAVALGLGLLQGAGSPSRRLAGGAVLGAAVMFKPNIAAGVLLLLLYWIAARRYRTATEAGTGILLGAGAAVSYGALRLGGFEAWSSWARAVRQVDYPAAEGNVALARVLSEVGLASTGRWLGLALLGLLCAAVAWAGGRGGRAPGAKNEVGVAEVLVFFAGINAGLLASRLVWLHYLVLVFPLVLLFAAAHLEGPGEERSAWRWRLPAWVALAAVGMLPLAGIGSPLLDAATAAAGMLLLQILAVAWLLHAGRGVARVG